MFTRPFLAGCIVPALASLTACSVTGSAVPDASPVPGTTVVATADAVTSAPHSETPEDALRRAAETLDRVATARDDAAAWAFYSQRCKDQIGSLQTYGLVLDQFYAGRTPDYTDWTVRVNGSSGQVVTVDSDPSAPAHAIYPRTWTFIDGRWQFDNC